MAESDRLNIVFKCTECGAESFSVADENDPESIAKCSGCGIELGGWGDICAGAEKMASDHLAAAAKKRGLTNK